jgi:hypothetical protein
MFTLNKSLQYVEAAEPDLVALHRSLNAVVIAPEGHKQQLCDAFLCVVKGNGKSERIYAALYLTAGKETLVYTPTASLPPVATSESISNALTFLEAMGFRMESYSLGGSTALREVIIRTISVLQPPGAEKKGTSLKFATKAPPKTMKPIEEQTSALHGTDEPYAESAPAADIEPERVVEEHAEFSRASATELAKLQAELECVRDEKCALESDLAAAHTELAQLIAARDETAAACPPGDDSAANSELAALQEEYEALRAEYILINEELTDLNTDLIQVRSEKDAAQEVAAEEIAALKATIMRLATTRPAASPDGPHPATDQEQPTVSPNAGQATRNHVESEPVGAAIQELANLSPVADIEALPRKHQVKPAQKGPTPFHLDHFLTAIPCGSPDDVIELRVSFNTVWINCDGTDVQNCSAYICGLERNGSKQIYVALYQTTKKKALIYAPSQQPEDSADYGQVMEDAISFADVAGFMINLEYLGGGPAERASVLQKIPVLGRG